MPQRSGSLRRLVAAAAAAAAVLTCALPPSLAETPVPTISEVSASRTPRPTPTKRPTATPNFASTQRAQDFDELLRDLEARGYVASLDGTVFDLQPFEGEHKESDWVWYLYDETGPDFVFSAQVKWSTATDTLGISGCGLAFGIQGEEVGYAVFLDDTRLQFVDYNEAGGERLFAEGAEPKFDYPNPADADMVIAVRGQRALVLVDGVEAEYKLSAEHGAEGEFGPAVTSGTSQGYGTRCAMSDVKMWLPD